MIILSDLIKIYGAGDTYVMALSGINLEIAKGDYVAITGPSGSGKSTLMNILGCLDKPSEGAYIFNGRETHDFNKKELAEFRNRSIGFVFQSYNLIPGLTALENVMLPMQYSGMNDRSARLRGTDLLDKVGLNDRLTHLPNALSGGQKQRVAIARALANEPELLLADEPTGNLDSKSSKEILDLFDNLNDRGITIIMITHDDESARRAQREVRIHDGQIGRSE